MAAKDIVPRPASTLILTRDSPAGLEVFMTQRTHEAVFMPGFYVFPGGAVDQADGSEALAGAGVADQAEHLAGADFQPGRLQRGNIATGNPVGFMDVLEFDHGRTVWLRRSQDFRRKAGILAVWRPRSDERRVGKAW